MPIYMDVHIVPGVTARDVAEAHWKDILVQGEHACKCMTYWVDEQRESIFCLIEAPEKQAVEEMHRHAHGLIPNKIIEVSTDLVESFLGRIYDPAEAQIADNGLKVFADPSFRILMLARITDPVLLQYELGGEKANELLNRVNKFVRDQLILHSGREVEHGNDGFIASFTSAGKAVACALAIQKNMPPADAASSGLRIAINGGEPFTKADKLFGDTLQLADHMCTIANGFQVLVASPVKALLSNEHLQNRGDNIVIFSPQDEECMQALFSSLEKHWQDPDFNVSEYCQAMIMSKSQLYRKTIELSGLSPNLLLKDFRLAKAKELMKKQRYTISQITFDSGFSSPSYFTKCFKKKYGLLPITYIDLLH